jgi:hypothetical protein
MMKFYSTKKESPDVDFKTALFQGIAPDGGFYMPRTIPRLDFAKINKQSTLQEVGFVVLRDGLIRKKFQIVSYNILLMNRLFFLFHLLGLVTTQFLNYFMDRQWHLRILQHVCLRGYLSFI